MSTIQYGEVQPVYRDSPWIDATWHLRQQQLERLRDMHHTDDTTNEPKAYRCIAYKPEIGAEVTETTMVANDADTARDLFVIELGAEKVKEGYKIKVFPVA